MIIYKYILDKSKIGVVQHVDLPIGFTVLDAGVKGGSFYNLFIWCLVDVTRPTKSVPFILFFTGDKVTDNEHVQYIKTIQAHNGTVYHLFIYED